MNAITIIGVVSAFALLFLSAIVWCARKGLLSCRREVRRFDLLPAVEKFLVALFAVGWMVFGGGKNDTTNSPPPGMMGPPMTMVMQTPTVVTEAETNAGHRVESIVEGNGIVPLVNATTNQLWRLRGGVNDAQRMENGELRTPDHDEENATHSWYFPYRDTFAGGLTVFANGEFQPNVKTTYFPKPFDTVLSLVPQGRWGEIVNGGPSLFMHELTPSNSLVLAWHNALHNRDANCPTNFQAELFADGRFEYRYPDHTTRYAPVFPFDWDGDGLENSVDPEPLVAGVDAHGTNAEWYDAVCSNVFTKVELPGNPNSLSVTLPNGESVYFRPGVNTNAYYFVDMVAERGPALIHFISDRNSRLGSPVVVANAGETNRVPLLIGIEYAITSSVPIAVSVPDAEYVTETRNNSCSVTMKWPLEFVFAEDFEGSNRVYTVTADPYDPGGAFAWNNAVSGGATLQGVTQPTECGCMTCSGNRIAFGCSANCDCGGNCTAKGIFSFEYAIFAVTGGVCRCGFDDPLPSSPPNCVQNDEPSFSIAFSKPTLIFENAYQNEIGVCQPRRSTRVRLTITAYGGTHGGAFVVAPQNFDKLTRVVGNVDDLTVPYSLAAGESFNAMVVYEATAASGSEGDVSYSGYFLENETGTRINANASLTVVRLELVPEVLFPTSLPNRHVFGVCEEMGCFHFPVNLTGYSWHASDNILDVQASGNHHVFQHLLSPGDARLTFSFGSVDYHIPIMCVAPSSIICTQTPSVRTNTVPSGWAGGIGMDLQLMLCPSNVSFRDIRVKEIATNDGATTGYFSDNSFSSWWNHSSGNGAETVVTIGAENDFGDRAEMSNGCPPIPGTGRWTTGSIIWSIPFTWREPSGFFMSRGFQNFSLEQQKFTIDETGTVGVEKFKRRVERTIDGHISHSHIP